jgi:hypothetical protein
MSKIKTAKKLQEKPMTAKLRKAKAVQPAPTEEPPAAAAKKTAKKAAAKKTTASKTTTKRPEISFTPGALVTASRKLGGGFEVVKNGDKYEVYFLNNRKGKRVLRRTVDAPEKVMKFLCSRSRISPFTSFQATDEALSKLAEQKDYRPLMAAA